MTAVTPGAENLKARQRRTETDTDSGTRRFSPFPSVNDALRSLRKFPAEAQYACDKGNGKNQKQYLYPLRHFPVSIEFVCLTAEKNGKKISNDFNKNIHYEISPNAILFQFLIPVIDNTIVHTAKNIEVKNIFTGPRRKRHIN